MNQPTSPATTSLIPIVLVLAGGRLTQGGRLGDHPLDTDYESARLPPFVLDRGPAIAGLIPTVEMLASVLLSQSFYKGASDERSGRK